MNPLADGGHSGHHAVTHVLTGSGRAAASSELDLSISYESFQGAPRACRAQKTTTSAPVGRWSW